MPLGFKHDRVVSGEVLNVQPGRPPTNNDQPGRNASPMRSLPDLLSDLQHTAAQHRLRVQDHFKDFDRHRDGTITVPQFQIAIGMTWSKHLPLTQAEVELIANEYQVLKRGRASVGWKAFVADINAVFSEFSLERDPRAILPANTHQRGTKLPELSADEEESVNKLLARLRWHFGTRRILVKPPFTDGEYNRNSMRVIDHVTYAQFEQCLSRLGLELNSDEMLLLKRKFDDLNDGFVNYAVFASIVDPEEANSNRLNDGPTQMLTQIKNNANFKSTKIADEQPGRSPNAADFPGLLSSREPEDLESLMKRLKHKISRFDIVLADAFVDFDKHKLGAISRAQFRRGLNSAFGDAYIRESLKEEELNTLEEEFKREMVDGAQFVDWNRICLALDGTPLASDAQVQESTISELDLPERQSHRMSHSGGVRLRTVLAQIAERFRIRSVYVKTPFHDFARALNSPKMTNHITRQQFVQGISRLGVELHEDDLQLLCKMYDDLEDSSVNYVRFCQDVDASEIRSSRRFSAVEFVAGFRHQKVFPMP